MSSASRSMATSWCGSTSSTSTRPAAGAHTLKRTPAGVGVAPMSMVQPLIVRTEAAGFESRESGRGAVGARGVFDGHFVTEAADGNDCWRRHGAQAQLYPESADMH